MPQMYIVYESAAGNTARMAKGVAEGAREVEGVEVALHRVAEAKAEDLAGADVIIIGAATRNTKVPPEMSEFLKGLKQLPLTGKIGAAFGSYGWSGKGMTLIRSALVAEGISVPGVGVRAKRTPDWAALGNCRELGQEWRDSSQKHEIRCATRSANHIQRWLGEEG